MLFFEWVIMEVMDELFDYESFYNFDMVFESLMMLCLKMLVVLLCSCRKIKVKWLFFVFVDCYDYFWCKCFDFVEFNFGCGDCVLVKGGRIYLCYCIVVLEEFVVIGVGDGV